jgi:hypothetical protein
VRPVRVFADPGGPRASVDARVSHIRVRAGEIADGLPHADAGRGLAWWPAAAALPVAAAAALWAVRRRPRSGA